MNCYRHRSVAAVGICKNCYKALCTECASDVGDGLACRESCERKVSELNQMWERSAKIYGIGAHRSRIPSTGVLLWGFLALVMWGVAGFSYFSLGKLDVAALVASVIFTIILGIAVYGARRTGLKC